jgi:hypothetical protein
LFSVELVCLARGREAPPRPYGRRTPQPTTGHDSQSTTKNVNELRLYCFVRGRPRAGQHTRKRTPKSREFPIRNHHIFLHGTSVSCYLIVHSRTYGEVPRACVVLSNPLPVELVCLAREREAPPRPGAGQICLHPTVGRFAVYHELRANSFTLSSRGSSARESFNGHANVCHVCHVRLAILKWQFWQNRH